MVDATGSMDAYWATAQEALATAVDEIKSRTDIPIQVKVVAYRDMRYDGSQSLLQSAWSDDSNYLKQWISEIQCGGGGDHPESVGLGLEAILQQQTSMTILIGDAPGHTGSEGFKEATICGKEQSPIHALYACQHGGVKEAWEKIAKLSGGKAFLLKPGLSGFTDVLKVLLLSNKKLMLDYSPVTEEGRQAKALLDK